MTDPQQPASRPPGGSEDDESGGMNRWVRPYLTDSTLWPVLFVLVTTLAMFGAAILLVAVRTRSGFAIVPLLALVVASAEALRPDLRRRRLGASSGLILVLWLLSTLLALGGAYLGVL